MLIVAKRITFRGFIVGDPDFGPKYAKAHQENVAKWLKDGSLKAKVDVTDGIDHAAEGLIGLFEGKNNGKAVL
jgi:NADPH-dependent curcumin reductase CurA